MPPQETSLIPRLLAVLLVCATFPLIWVGGLVTTTQAGMAVPDWPSTYGYNLFLYPWQTWLFGPLDVLIEHGHRLRGAIVGLITIGLVAASWWYDQRRWLRWFSLLVLLAVIGQGVLGGMRVRLGDVALARLHGCTGPLFFALVVSVAVFTSRSWIAPRAVRLGGDTRILRWAGLATLLIYLQLVVGANLRHVHVMLEPSVFRLVVLFHLGMVLVVVAYVAGLFVAVWRNRRQAGQLLPATTALVLLSMLQIALGLGTWFVKYATPEWWNRWIGEQSYTIIANGALQASVVTAHVANGSLLLVVALTISLRGWRMCHSSWPGSLQAAESGSAHRLGVVL